MKGIQKTRIHKGLCTALAVCFLAAIPAAADVRPFSLNWVTDGITAGAGIAAAGAGLFFKPDASIYSGVKPPLSDINAFDRLAVFQYSHALDVTGDVFQYLAFLTPAILFMAPTEEWLTIGVMYAETALLSFGVSSIMKSAIQRTRPFMYRDNPPLEAIADGDWNQSFPSRHTTLAFSGATFASYVFASYFPDSPLTIPVIAGSYALALTTAVLRVTSGNHFMTDVIAGAAIGSAIGFLVPWLHTLGTAKTSPAPRNADGTEPAGMLYNAAAARSGADFAVMGNGVMCTVRF